MINLIIMLLSTGLTVALLPYFIQQFKQRKLGQITREEGPLWHEAKTGTPTMGGTVFVVVIALLSIGVTFFLDLHWEYALPQILTILLFGCIGFVDDFISIFHQRNEGLTARQKFLLQIFFSLIVIFIGHALGIQWQLNLFHWQIHSLILVAAFACFWIVGFSNAVNLTDGLDGLATGLSIIAYATYGYIAYHDRNITVGLITLIAIGSLLGFLHFNKKPAKIFMGDVGSLAIGASLAVIAMMLNRPLSLLMVGFVFVVETASVILQVASFKTTGKRLFKMSPIHHHFEMVGWSEQRVVYTFWVAGLISAITYLFIAVF